MARVSNLPRPQKGQRFGGRAKGTPNKFTAAVKETIEAAFHQLGGVKYLVEVGRSNPQVFCSLLGKILPREVVGEGGGPLQIAGVVSVYMPDNGRRNDGPVLTQQPNKSLRIQPRKRSGIP